MKNEVSVMQQTTHQNLVRYYTFKLISIEGCEFIDIVMNLCDGTLNDFVDHPIRFPKFKRLDVVKQCLSGVQYLHNVKQSCPGDGLRDRRILGIGSGISRSASLVKQNCRIHYFYTVVTPNCYVLFFKKP
mgnify:CR=1 FL=1